MKIYVLDAFHPAGIEYAKKNAELIPYGDPRAKNWHEDADGLMVRLTRLKADDFARAKKLKCVCKQGVGIENIDLEAAKRHGVIVCSTPGINSEAVADMALALGLGVARRIGEFDRMSRSGVPYKRSDYLGIELWGKTVAILGMGNIGSRVARKWRGAYEATILAYDPYAPKDAWADIPHERCASLDALLPRADVLTVHTPLTPETRNLIAARELARMKSTAIIVNTSRGGIIDEAALYQAIKGGKLFGAGIDAFVNEPPTADDPLMTLPTVLGAPHAGGGTFETQENSSMTVAVQLIDVLNGKPPIFRNA